MCDPVTVAAASAALQYQQSVAAQKNQRNAQIRQNEIANQNLQNKRRALQENLIRKTKKNLKILGIKEKEARAKKAKFLASDRGISQSSNTYQFLLNNFQNNIGDIRDSVLGNIRFDAQQFQNDYSNLNTMYESQTTFVTTVDRVTAGMAAGLNFAKDYNDYKSKMKANELDKKYSYGDFNMEEYEMDRM